jgi:hypothetical protein
LSGRPDRIQELADFKLEAVACFAFDIDDFANHRAIVSVRIQGNLEFRPVHRTNALVSPCSPQRTPGGSAHEARAFVKRAQRTNAKQIIPAAMPDIKAMTARILVRILKRARKDMPISQ